MNKFKVTKECYYGEKGAKPRHMKPGMIYESATLSPEKAPSYFTLINAQKVAAPAAPVSLGLSYNEMKKFVKDNDIDVADTKKETLEAAIIAFQKDVAAKKKIEEKGEADAKKVAGDLKAGEAKADNDPEQPMTQGGE